MFGRNRSADDAVNAVGSALDDVKAGAKAGAIKGAAVGALGTLGAKAAEAAQNAPATGADLSRKARKAQKQAGKMLAEAADTAGKQAQEAGKKADLEGKSAAAAQVLQMLSKRAGDATQSATSGATHINLNVNDIPRLLRGTALVATGLGTLFAPGSALDVSQRADGSAARMAGGLSEQLSDQARQGIDTAAELTQQRIRDVVDLAKDALSSLSDALTTGIEVAESRVQQALEETETRLTQATEQVAETAKGPLPAPRKRGGTVRWLFYGLLLGGLAAFFSSPLSGPIGERVSNLRRDLGLGGNQDDDSQYWPSPPQQSTGTSGTTTGAEASAGGDQAPIDLSKTENWKDNSDTKENKDKV